MKFSIYISTLSLLAAALVYEDAYAINVDGFTSSTDCSSSGAPLKGSFSLNPTGPNTVRLSVDADLDEELGSPLKAVVKIRRKVLWWWVTVPCVGNYGSCTYDDMCRFLTPGPCPAQFQDLPTCQCPLQTGVYRMDSEINVPSISLPSWLTSGDYNAQIKLYKYSREVGCNEITFSV